VYIRTDYGGSTCRLPSGGSTIHPRPSSPSWRSNARSYLFRHSVTDCCSLAFVVMPPGGSVAHCRCCLLILILHIVRWSCVLSCSVSHSTAPMISVGSGVKVVSSSASHHRRRKFDIQNSTSDEKNSICEGNSEKRCK
jgi:hypothetical protein